MIFTSSIVSSGMESDRAAVGVTVRNGDATNATRKAHSKRQSRATSRRGPLRDRRTFLESTHQNVSRNDS